VLSKLRHKINEQTEEEDTKKEYMKSGGDDNQQTK
jgi:hypothetical protein